jgi:hypothetical protein
MDLLVLVALVRIAATNFTSLYLNYCQRCTAIESPRYAASATIDAALRRERVTPFPPRGRPGKRGQTRLHDRKRFLLQTSPPPADVFTTRQSKHIVTVPSIGETVEATPHTEAIVPANAVPRTTRPGDAQVRHLPSGCLSTAAFEGLRVRACPDSRPAARIELLGAAISADTRGTSRWIARRPPRRARG